MENEIIILDENDLKNKIYTIRGVQVMLDSDLAEIYGYETKRFNEQVKNNIERFDEDFRFQLTQDEVDVLPVLRAGLQNKKKVLIPRIIDGTNDMEFYFLTDEPNSQVEVNGWGIAEPKSDLRKCNLDELLSELKADEILVLVPGLAFGKDHSRLGHGAGFYDKFLGNLKNMTGGRAVFVGVSYGALVFDSVPHESHDVSMDMLIGDFHVIL